MSAATEQTQGARERTLTRHTAHARARELERMLGKKTLEAEILKEALEVARVKKPTLQLPLRQAGGSR